jgi:hypothetical protein
MDVRVSISFALSLACVSQTTGRKPSTEAVSRGSSDPWLTAVNQVANPCSSFAAYACGAVGAYPGRLQREMARLDRTPEIRKFLDEILAGRHDDGTNHAALIRAFYARCLDPRARAEGLDELRLELDRIAQIGTLPSLA